MMEKNEVRKKIRKLKRNYSPVEKKEKSEWVWQQVEKDPYFNKAATVLLYWSMEDEVFTHDFVVRCSADKKILLPCVKGDELEIRYFEGIDRLCPGAGYCIPEPVGDLCEHLGDIDVIIVPGVAFDRENNRLGRGKGYYDKILKCTPAYKIGVCFDFQLLDIVPTDGFDIPMDRVIVSD